jgi:urocanate hydratase
MSTHKSIKEMQDISDRIYSDLNRLSDLALQGGDQEKLVFPRFTMVLIRNIYVDGTLSIRYIAKEGV